MAMHVTPVSTTPPALSRIMKFLLPVTSLNRNMPHSDEISPGPVDMIGKVVTNERSLLATNHAVWGHNSHGQVACG